jgi:hypothetical protein
LTHSLEITTQKSTKSCFLGLTKAKITLNYLNSLNPMEI